MAEESDREVWTITCPNCNAEKEELYLPDAVYTEVCTNCMQGFSYRVKDGKIEPYPPRVNQAWKGAGTPGGKNERTGDDPV